jgi:hypothetical protein
MTKDPLRHLMETIRRNLSQGLYRDRDAAVVREAIVLPILQSLGWDLADLSAVRRSYSAGPEGQGVDYGLLASDRSQPVLLDVVEPGALEDEPRHAAGLIDRAAKLGSPLVVLTDGLQWRFYVPERAGQSEQDVLLCDLDLWKAGALEACTLLSRYLAFRRVWDMQAISDARQDLELVRQRRTALEYLRAAWSALVEERDSLLVDLIREKIQQLGGPALDPEQVGDFLASFKIPNSDRAAASYFKFQPKPAASIPAAERPRPSQLSDLPAGQASVSIGGRVIRAKNATQALLVLLRELAGRDASLLGRLAPALKGKVRSYIAASPQGVHPTRPDLRHYVAEIVPGWFLDTDISNSRKQRIAEEACRAAGLRLGRDVMLEIP